MAQQTSEKLKPSPDDPRALSIAGFVWWLSVFTEPTQFAWRRRTRGPKPRRRR
jgi:hypothetical protein